MQSQQLTALLELVKECREALASGRIADGAHIAMLAEAELADLMGLDVPSVDQSHHPLSYGQQGILAHTCYSGPFRRKTDVR
jgi:hypothetical protein